VKKNNKLLLKLWVPIIIFILFFVIGFTNNSNIEILYGIVPVIIISISFLIASLKLKQSKTKINEALQSQSPAVLIDVIVEPLKFIKKVSLKESSIAYNTALAYTLYGDYDKAREVIERLEWETKEPMVQALYFSMKSLICYFDDEHRDGLSYARKARELGGTSLNFPGARKSNETYEAYIEIGQILNGFGSEQIIRSLERKFNKLPLLPKIIIAWGLMHGYKDKSDFNGYNSMQEFCNVNAPHCKSLRVSHEDINFA